MATEAEAAGAAAAGEAMRGGEARRGGGGEEAFPRAYEGNGEPSPDPAAAAAAGAFAAAIRDGTGEGMRTGGDAGRAYGLSLSPSCNGFAAERAALRRLLGE